MNVEIVSVKATEILKYTELLSYALIERIEKGNGSYLVLGAKIDGRVCGVLVAKDMPEAICLYGLRVSQKYMRLGIATMLFNGFIEGTPRNWPTDLLMCSFTPQDFYFRGDPGYCFLRLYDFRFKKAEGGLCVTTLSALKKKPFFSEVSQASQACKPLSQISDSLLNEFNRRCKATLNLEHEPYVSEGVLEDISCAAVINGQIESIAVISKRDDVLEFSWLYGTAKYLSPLLKAVCHKACQVYADVDVYIPMANDKSVALAKKLCPDADFIPTIEATGTLLGCRARIEAEKRFDAIMEGV